tara:strand:- start:643 stop:1788 length:1146 start_codon:yes stop_codon:yes gene_type:complete
VRQLPIKQEADHVVRFKPFLFVMICCAWMLLGCGAPTGNEAHLESDPRAFSVETVTKRSIPRVYETPGTFVSDDRIQVASRLAAFIRSVDVREGQVVKRGDTLFRLDAADVEGAVRQAEAAAAQARSVFEDANADVGRFERLYETDSVAQTELRQVQLARDVARDKLRQAEAGVTTARSQRRYTTVTSPVSGVVIARHKQSGDLASPGQPIITLESQKAVLFDTYVAESVIRFINVGDLVELHVDALNDLAVTGEVLRIVPSGDVVTRRFQVKIAPGDEAGLLPGMFGRAAFRIGEDEALVLPNAAIALRGGLDGVFVVDTETRARFRMVRKGRQWQNRSEVIAGLQADETVILNPDASLRDGDRVIPKNDTHISDEAEDE